MSFPCEARCGRRLYLSAYCDPNKPKFNLDEFPPLEIKIRALIQPAPMGCIMPMGQNFLMFWLDAPMQQQKADAGSTALATTDRPQVFGPYVLCLACMRVGGFASVPEMLGLFKSGMAPRTLIGLMMLITQKAAQKVQRAKDKAEAAKKATGG